MKAIGIMRELCCTLKIALMFVKVLWPQYDFLFLFDDGLNAENIQKGMETSKQNYVMQLYVRIQGFLGASSQGM
jgi:hypothetical protein